MYRLPTRVTVMALLLGTLAVPAINAGAAGTPLTSYCSSARTLPRTIQPFTTHMSRSYVYKEYTRNLVPLRAIVKMYNLARYGELQLQPGERSVVDAAYTNVAKVDTLEGIVAGFPLTSAFTQRVAEYSATSFTAARAYAVAMQALSPLVALTCNPGAPSTSVPPTTPTTTPEPTTVPTTPPVTMQVMASGARISINAASVHWDVSGLLGVYRVAFYTFKGSSCSIHAHSASSNYSPALNISGGMVTSTGQHFYYPVGQYSGYVVVIAKTGTTQSPCVYLGRS